MYGSANGFVITYNLLLLLSSSTGFYNPLAGMSLLILEVSR